ncbi:apolipoprotein D-like [Panonychus citri]|uniref:apolipoprotein D-like n=1 Tax=Panonychus citri TaxID=50023 RepID=UPI002306F494|nr:apolipoprotein D-like [Panonychus citri]
MIGKTLIALLIVTIIGSVHSDILLSGPCPSVPVPDDFSWDKIQGSWYVIKSTTDSKGEYDYCPVDKYRVLDNNTITYTNQFSLEGYLRGQGGPGLVDPSQKNKISIRFRPKASSFDRYIAATDYKTYIAVFGCKPKGSKQHEVYGRILSKELNAPAESKLAAYLALQNLGIPATTLINADQDCEFNPSIL